MTSNHQIHSHNTFSFVLVFGCGLCGRLKLSRFICTACFYWKKLEVTTVIITLVSSCCLLNADGGGGRQAVRKTDDDPRSLCRLGY